MRQMTGHIVLQHGWLVAKCKRRHWHPLVHLLQRQRISPEP